MVEPTHLVAIFIALGAALASASQSLLVRIGTGRGRATDAVLVVMLVNVIVLGPLVAVVYYPDYGLTRVSWLSFVAAGLLGTLLGRAFMYTSISRIGASRTAPIISSQALIATILGVALLGESLLPVHALAIVLIVIGVAGIAWETGHENPDGLTRRELVVGLSIPLGAALAFGMEPIFASFGFAEGTPAPVGLVVKTVAALFGFTLYLRWHDALPTTGVLRSSNTRWFLLAGVGNTLFLLGYYVALEMAPVNVVVPLIITNTLFVLLLSAAFMPQRLENVTWRLATAALVVVVGVLVITLFG